MAYPYLFDEALQDLGLWRADWVRELVARYRSHRCSLALLDGVRPMLERLAGRYPLFLITDGAGELQRFKVGQLRISKFFRLILYTGDYGAGWCKPATHLFARASTLLHLPAEACLFIGDDPDRDMEGARRAGMATARVLNGPYRHRPCLPPPDLVLNRVSELESVLEPLTPATGEGIGGGEPWARSVSCM
jgi:putative hydrolase of the HAD superfamily